MASSPDDREALRHLTPDDVDDAYKALMEGLRTTLPGVMVLFAFLLTIPVQVSFLSLTFDERTAYYIAFVSSAIAAILLIAPSAHQRVRAPQTGIRRRSARHLWFTVRMTIVGTAFFAVALGAATYLVTAIVLDQRLAAAVTALIVLLAAWAWFWLPAIQFEHD